jgi:hypothetical protein
MDRFDIPAFFQVTPTAAQEAERHLELREMGRAEHRFRDEAEVELLGLEYVDLRGLPDRMISMPRSSSGLSASHSRVGRSKSTSIVPCSASMP